jgi:aspartyl protease family protein
LRRATLLILLLGLSLSLALLVARHEDGTIAGLLNEDFASLSIKIALLVFLGGIVLALFKERFSHAVESALIWVVIALLLVLGYSYRFELRDVAERVAGELMPGYVASRGRIVEIARGRSGDFPLRAHVNGAQIAMVLDTGASSVVLTQEAAKAAGLPLEVLKYTVNVDTANGRASAAPVTLDRIGIGNLVERSVPALIAQPGQLKTSLLGMSFLNRLERWEVRGDKLMLRGYP